MQVYDHEYSDCRETQSNLAEIMIQIRLTVDPSSYYYLINNCRTPWSMLVRLKGAFKPSEEELRA